MTTTLQTPAATNVTPKYENIDAYQSRIREFRLPSYNSDAALLGLLAETGEVAAIFQKFIRGDYTIEQVGPLLSKELGDVLWHIAAIADDNGWALSDIATSNIDKLESRKLRNVLLGNGDNR